MVPFDIEAFAQEVAYRLDRVQAGSELTRAMIARSRDQLKLCYELLSLEVPWPRSERLRCDEIDRQLKDYRRAYASVDDEEALSLLAGVIGDLKAEKASIQRKKEHK